MTQIADDRVVAGTSGGMIGSCTSFPLRNSLDKGMPCFPCMNLSKVNPAGKHLE